ncbi:hypothetical protein, partial [Bacillus cereus group sp. BfR-BA-01347]|uniref:hypothetical protein n=1 Tax=Bacillus cereus group sp. BfR-BA-01347 TaxID=2920310 RepID=UPI001F56467E
KYRFTAWIFSFEENLAIKNAPPIVRLCLTIGVHFIMEGWLFFYYIKEFYTFVGQLIYLKNR